MKVKRVGEISSAGEYRYGFLFERVAITVGKWIEHGAEGDEAGCRIEIRRLEEEEAGSEFAGRRMCLAQPIWRGDLFTLAAGEPGNWDRAHYHPRFHGIEPSERAWDPELTKSPVDWLRKQLEDNLDGILQEGGAPDLAAGDDLRLVREVLPRILTAVEECL
jgi:hypothetical protein